MPRFQNSEIGFEVPEGWTDLSMTSFAFPEAASSVSLTSAPAAAGATLAECEESVLAMFDAIFPDLELVERQVRNTGAGEVVELVVEWTSDDVILRQSVALLLADGRLWSLAASTPKACLDDTEAAIERTLRSFGRNAAMHA